MTWNHRIIRYTNTDRGFGVHEVYYNSNGSVATYTVEPIQLEGEDLDDLGFVISEYPKILELGILNEEDLPG